MLAIKSAESKEGRIMKNGVGKFSFAIPGGHPQAGEKIEKSFEYDMCENESEATQVLKDKNLSVLDMVNDKLKANARSNAYQSAVIVYRPSTVEPEEIKERMVRDYIRLGVAEDVARKQVDALLPATSGQ